MSRSEKESGPEKKRRKVVSGERKNIHGEFFDPIISSLVIKKEFLRRCEMLDIDPYDIATRQGVPHATFDRLYIKAREPKRSPDFTSNDLISMCKKVGMIIKIDVYLEPITEVSEKLYAFNKGE